ncbi:hypothetical protein ACFL9U_07645 [Thermodesulfobacteriota bacterium]
MSELVSVESNSVKAFVEAEKMDVGERFLLEILVLFGFTLIYARVLSGLNFGYLAESR